jgi:hypothetical protein
MQNAVCGGQSQAAARLRRILIPILILPPYRNLNRNPVPGPDLKDRGRLGLRLRLGLGWGSGFGAGIDAGIKSRGRSLILMIWCYLRKEKNLPSPKNPKNPKKHRDEGMGEKAEIGKVGGQTLKN